MGEAKARKDKARMETPKEPTWAEQQRASALAAERRERRLEIGFWVAMYAQNAILLACAVAAWWNWPTCGR